MLSEYNKWVTIDKNVLNFMMHVLVHIRTHYAWTFIFSIILVCTPDLCVPGECYSSLCRVLGIFSERVSVSKMAKSLAFRCLFTMVMIPGFVVGFSTGADESACGTMIPFHFPATPQTSLAPYTVTITRSTYTSGESMTGMCVHNLLRTFTL